MLSTSLELDNNSLNSTGLPVFANLRQTWNEYRIGADVEFAGFRFTVLRRWDYFKQDTPYSAYGIATSAALGVPNDLTTIQTFTKAQPVHGRNPGWLGNRASTPTTIAWFGNLLMTAMSAMPAMSALRTEGITSSETESTEMTRTDRSSASPRFNRT